MISPAITKPLTKHASEAENFGEITSLTGLRGIAVSLIVLQHVWLETHHDGLAFVDHYFRGAASLWFGVDLFFVLSGFLLTRNLLRTKTNSNYFRNFFAKRTLRIWPLYFLLLSLALAYGVATQKAGGFEATLKTIAWPAIFASNIYISLYGWNLEVGGFSLIHLWSLGVEEQIYLCLPFFVRWLKTSHIIAMSLLLFACTNVARAIFLNATGKFDAIGVLTPFRLDAFCAGCAVACIISLNDKSKVLKRNLFFVWSATSVAIILMIVKTHLFRGNFFVSTLGYSLFAFNFAGAIGILATRSESRVVSTALSHPLLMFLGRHSYCIYLFHLPIARLINLNLVARHMVPNAFSLVAFGMLLPIGISLVTAIISWRIIELPCLRLGRSISSH